MRQFDLKNPPTVEELRALEPGQRVRYQGWRGPLDSGEGTFLRHIFRSEYKTPPSIRFWGRDKLDALLVKRDFSADDGRLFRPFAGDGEMVEPIRPPEKPNPTVWDRILSDEEP